MLTRFCLILMLLEQAIMAGRAAPIELYPLLSTSDSPNNEYRFEVVKFPKNGVDTLNYVLVHAATGQPFMGFDSSYQVAGKDDPWGLQQARGAKVFWSVDGTRFALDEADFHFMGNLFIGFISPDKKHVTYQKCEPESLGIWNLKQWRFHVTKGWVNPTTLNLEFHAFTDLTKPPFTQNLICYVDALGHIQISKAK